MFDVGQSLQPGLDRAQAQLADVQRAVARANAGHGRRGADAAMAAAASAAVFDEALLNVVHSRLAELKAVTR